jgi:hypothetical protein
LLSGDYKKSEWCKEKRKLRKRGKRGGEKEDFYKED